MHLSNYSVKSSLPGHVYRLETLHKSSESCCFSQLNGALEVGAILYANIDFILGGAVVNTGTPLGGGFKSMCVSSLCVSSLCVFACSFCVVAGFPLRVQNMLELPNSPQVCALRCADVPFCVIPGLFLVVMNRTISYIVGLDNEAETPGFQPL